MIPVPTVRVSCPRCGKSRIEALPTVLRGAGMLRRNREVDWGTMWQLLRAAQSRLACDECASVGLCCEQVSDDDQEAWPSAPICVDCRQPIPPERVQLFPDAKVCAACQQRRDQREDSVEHEYCPRCGAVLQVRSSRRSGLSRYEMSCSACGYRG